MTDVKTVIGLFSEHEDAQAVLERLQKEGYDPKDISLIMRDRHQAEHMSTETGVYVGEGAASGAATGAMVGGLTGLLIGIGVIAIPGIGAILIGGPLAAAMGLTGAAATTASGAFTGALAGGLIGALMNLGLPHHEAKQYEARIHEGAILLAVPVQASDTQRVERLLREYSASDVKSLNMDEPLLARDDNRSAENLATPVQVQRYLKHVDYPASKDELVQEAAEEGADKTVIHTLQELPQKRFSSPTSVTKALGSLA